METGTIAAVLVVSGGSWGVVRAPIAVAPLLGHKPTLDAGVDFGQR